MNQERKTLIFMVYFFIAMMLSVGHVQRAIEVMQLQDHLEIPSDYKPTYREPYYPGDGN